MPVRSNTELLLNTGAGSGAAELPAGEIVRRLSACGLQVNLRELGDGSDVAEAARAAVQSHPDLVVTGGGDGTLSTVAGVLAGTGIPLGILPLGTLNHFAGDLGIPPDIDAALKVICEGEPRPADVARVNGRVFINNSSLGFYPQVLHKRDELRNRLGHRKWPAFLWALVFVFRRFPLLDVRITLDGATLARRTPLLFVGNNRYELTATRFGVRRQIDEAILSVHVINRTDRFGLLSLAAHAAVGRLPRHRNFETLHATRLEVSAGGGRVTVATDGELNRLSTPLIYETEPGALLVLVSRQPNPGLH